MIKINNIVITRNVSKFFADKRTTALQNVSFKIQGNEFVSIIGPSGCGKTTILQMIAGIADQGKEEGQILVNNKSPDKARQDRAFGIVLQEAALFNNRTVLRNVTLPLEIAAKRRNNHYEKAEKLLRMVGLNPDIWKDHYPFQLSGGMKQRVAIARALINNPRLLLMDEPFGALDAITREKMNFELLRIWNEAQNLTIIFVTHSIEEAVWLSQRILVMSSHPGTIEGEVFIDLSNDRTSKTKEEKKYWSLVKKTKALMNNDH